MEGVNSTSGLPPLVCAGFRFRSAKGRRYRCSVLAAGWRGDDSPEKKGSGFGPGGHNSVYVPWTWTISERHAPHSTCTTSSLLSGGNYKKVLDASAGDGSPKPSGGAPASGKR